MHRSLGAIGRRALTLFAPILLFGTACDDSAGIVRGRGLLRSNQNRIDFGRVFIGLAPNESVELRNAGDAPVSFQARVRGFGDFAFQPSEALLAPSSTLQLQVLFQPFRLGEQTISIELIDTETPDEVAITIEVVGLGVAVPDCEDGNGCTSDRFDLTEGRCIHTAESVPCNDFNACTGGDTCIEGICLGSSVLCDDGDSCTDDACDAEAGCIHIPTARCNDNNPCTRDICLPDGGCQHLDLSDGVPCDDGELCTTADVCFNGRCIGVNIPEGSPCDDGDPCSLNDQCLSGECRDPTYTPPLVGEVAFTATVAALGPNAAENIIVDRNDTAFFGTNNGIAAVDECGNPLWANTDLGPQRFRAAVGLPGLLTVPAGARIRDIDTRSGEVLRTLDLSSALPALTSSTATATATILDMAVRASGALVASMVQTVTTTTSTTTSGYLVEVNALHTIATPLEMLGPLHAPRIALDEDESVVAVLRRGPIDVGEGAERVVRLGIDGVPDGTWSSFEVGAVRTEIALGEDGEVIWAGGETSIDRQGSPLPLGVPPDDPSTIRRGAPITFDSTIYFLVDGPEGPGSRLVARTATTGAEEFDLELPDATIQHSPAVDAGGRVYLITAEGNLLIVSRQGAVIFETTVPLISTPLEGVSLTLTSRGFILLTADDALISIRGLTGLAASSWPRHRRDNLSTGHR